MAKETNGKNRKEQEAIREQAIIKENERWKDYAGALGVAIPILLGALAIYGEKTAYSVVSAIAGTLSIVLVVLWYARGENRHGFTPGDRYPTALYYASWLFGIQVVFLLFSLVFTS